MIEMPLTSVVPSEPGQVLRPADLNGLTVMPQETQGSQLVEALESLLVLAKNQRQRDLDVQQRLDCLEKEQQALSADAAHWKSRYQALDQKNPWWMRKLLGL